MTYRSNKFLSRSLPIAALCAFFTGAWSDAAFSLDVNSQGAKQERSMDDVARMIRQTQRWQILEARPRKKGTVMRYRFKLISTSGQVKIISIDPIRPNLRRLEQ